MAYGFSGEEAFPPKDEREKKMDPNVSAGDIASPITASASFRRVYVGVVAVAIPLRVLNFNPVCTCILFSISLSLFWELTRLYSSTQHFVG